MNPTKTIANGKGLPQIEPLFDEMARMARGPFAPVVKPLMAFGLVINLLMLVPTVYMLQIFDRVLLSENSLTLMFVSIIAIYLFGLLAFAEWFRARLLVRAALRFDLSFGQRVFAGLFDRAALPGGTQKGLAAIAELRQFLVGPAFQAALDLPFTPIFVMVLFLLHPLLGAFAVVFFGVQLFWASLAHKKLLLPQQHASNLTSQESALLQANLRHADVSRALGMQPALLAQWQAQRQDSLAAIAKSQSLSAALGSVSKFMRYLQQGLSLAIGAWLVIEGELSPGAMIAANVLTSRALAPVDQLAGSWQQFLQAKANYAEANELLERGAPYAQMADSTHVALGHVMARNLFLRQPGRDEPVIKNITFEITPGSLVAVVGESGAGKSSLARALLGNWPAGQLSGELRLGGHTPNRLWMQATGQRVGYLAQEIELFETSVAKNIARLAEPDSQSAQLVVAAAQAVGIHEDILRLPQGYETPVPAGAGLISTGLRQRIGIARALYAGPQLVILDEPTSHLDEAADLAFLETLKELKASGQATVIVITHRKNILGLADRVLRLSQGELVAT